MVRLSPGPESLEAVVATNLLYLFGVVTGVDKMEASPLIDAERAHCLVSDGAGGTDAPYRGDHVGRGRVLDVHVGLDRRSEGRQARPHHPDGGSQAHGPARDRHPRG